MRQVVARAVLAGFIAGLVYALWRKVRARVPVSDRALEWQTAPFPFPPVPRPAKSASSTSESAAAPAPTAEPWVEPFADGACPASHPVKVKLSSRIYHVPGGANYDRTKADRCYVDAAAAEADGHRPSKH